MKTIDRLKGDEYYLDAIDDAIAVIEQQAAIIKKFAKHAPGCVALEQVRGDDGRFARCACSCGLDRAIAKAEKVGQ